MLSVMAAADDEESTSSSDEDSDQKSPPRRIEQIVEESEPEEEEEMAVVSDWHLDLPSLDGTLTARTYGQLKDLVAITVHGKNPSLVGEWEEDVAPLLASAGCYVVCLDFHSNPATKPGVLDEDQFICVMDEVHDQSITA